MTASSDKINQRYHHEYANPNSGLLTTRQMGVGLTCIHAHYLSAGTTLDPTPGKEIPERARDSAVLSLLMVLMLLSADFTLTTSTLWCVRREPHRPPVIQKMAERTRRLALTLVMPGPDGGVCSGGSFTNRMARHKPA